MNRTNSTEQTTFSIPGPASATFNFSRRDNIQITVPIESTWRARYHWHLRGLGCERIICTGGRLKVTYVSNYGSGSSSMPRGCDMRFKPGQRVAWARDDAFRQDLVVTLVADETLYRNTCSAILDADRFPHFTTTPLWLRLLFAMLMWWPAAQSWLIARLLWVQLQAMHYSHDHWVYHGQLNVTSWWNWTIGIWTWSRPPKSLVRFQKHSQTVISCVTQTTCYWTGRLLLGMKGQYAEYTPRPPTSYTDEIKC